MVRLDELKTTFETALTTLPHVSMRVGFADPDLVSARRGTASRIKEHLAWIRLRLVLLRKGADDAAASDVASDDEDTTDLADALAALSAPASLA